MTGWRAQLAWWFVIGLPAISLGSLTMAFALKVAFAAKVGMSTGVQGLTGLLRPLVVMIATTVALAVVFRVVDGAYAYFRARSSLKRAERLEAGALLSSRRRQGVITATEHDAFPVLLREGSLKGTQRPRVVATVQAFIVEDPDGAWLLDTPYIDVIGGTPSVDGLASISGSPLDAWVGSEVIVAGEALEEATAPHWYEGGGRSAGYRTRTLRRLVGTERRPIQVWVRSGSGRVVVDDDADSDAGADNDEADVGVHA